MRTTLIAVTCIALVLSAVAVKAQKQAVPEDSTGMLFRFQNTGENLSAYMPASTLRKSPNLDFANPELPKSLKEIIDIAFAELEKSADKQAGWTCTQVNLWQPGWDNKHADVNGKWFYVVVLEGPYGNPGGLMLPVTLDGRPGVIKNKKKDVEKPAAK